MIDIFKLNSFLCSKIKFKFFSKAFCPALSLSKASVIVLLFNNFKCSYVNAVPIVATALNTFAFAKAMTSIWPSTM